MNEKLTIIPRLVITDWDGTFAEQGSSPRLEAIQARDKLLSAGTAIVLVSGRSVKEALEFVREYKFSEEFIAELGTVIYHHGEELINYGNLRQYEGTNLYSRFVHYLDEEEVSAHDAMFHIGVVDNILEQTHKRGLNLRIYTPKDGHPSEVGTNIMQKKGTVLMRGLIETNTINALLDQEAPFLEVKDNGLVEDESGDHAYHLTIKGANKEFGVTMLQQLLGISREESIGLGDSLSDLSLSVVVNRFYLMKNGLTHTPNILDRFRKSLSQSLVIKIPISQLQ